jgi:hypothetical protein
MTWGEATGDLVYFDYFSGPNYPTVTELQAKSIEVRIMVENHCYETNRVNQLSFRLLKSEWLYNKECRNN